MLIEFAKGSKHKNDRKILLTCDSSETLTFTQLGTFLLYIMQNEDILYPKSKGLDGGKMLLYFLEDLYANQGITRRMVVQYRLDTPKGLVKK